MKKTILIYLYNYKKKMLQSRFQGLNAKNIVRILESVFVNETNIQQDRYSHIIANSGIFAFLNANSSIPSENHIFDLMSTQVWLHLLIHMGIFEGEYVSSLQWNNSITNYIRKVITEHRYTSRVHDLLAISKSSTISVAIKNAAKCLLYELITPVSSEMERRFLLGEMNDILILDNETIKVAVARITRNVIFDDMKYWDVRRVTDMSRLCRNIHAVNSTLDLTYWDTSNVTNMSGMFSNTHVNIVGITYWNTKKLISMYNMFNESYFNQPLEWNTSNVQTMKDTFYNAYVFNQPLFWNTKNVRDMSGMFGFARSFNQPIHFDTQNVRDMSGMFLHAQSFNQPLYFNTSNVTNMLEMFHEASSFNQWLDWDTSNVRDMSNMFENAESFNQPLHWNTSNVRDMRRMFYCASSFNQPLHFNTSNVTTIEYMFGYATSFNQSLQWNLTNIDPNELANIFEESQGRFV